MSKTVILYHASCMDGTGSRYAAWKKFGKEAIYLAAQYGQPLPDFPQNKKTDVFMLDFSVSREALESLRLACKSVVVIDHHVTAFEALQGLPDVFMDMSKSGAVLAWEYFHPNDPVPMLLQYIQDRDLWKFEMKESGQVHMGLNLLKGDLKAWDKYTQGEDNLSELIDKGETLLERQRIYVADQVPSQIRVINFMGYKAGIHNGGEIISERGDAICNDPILNVDLALMWYVTKDNGIVLSMRSKPGSDVHVGNLCKVFGGGGHPGAAGCRIDFATLKQILDGQVK